MSVLLQIEVQDAKMLRRLLLGADATTIVRDGSEAPARVLKKLDTAIAESEKREAERQARARADAEELRPYFEQAEAEGKYVRSTYFLPQGPGEWTGYVSPPLGTQTRDWVGVLKLFKEDGLETQLVVKSRRDGIDVEGYRFRPAGQADSIYEADLYEETGRCTACGLARSDAHVRDCTLGSVRHRFPAADAA